MKKIYCDFCGGEIGESARRYYVAKEDLKMLKWNKILIQSVTNKQRQDDSWDVCGNCVEKVSLWITIYKKLMDYIIQYDDTGKQIGLDLISTEINRMLEEFRHLKVFVTVKKEALNNKITYNKRNKRLSPDEWRILRCPECNSELKVVGKAGEKYYIGCITCDFEVEFIQTECDKHIKMTKGNEI